MSSKRGAAAIRGLVFAIEQRHGLALLRSARVSDPAARPTEGLLPTPHPTPYAILTT